LAGLTESARIPGGLARGHRLPRPERYRGAGRGRPAGQPVARLAQDLPGLWQARTTTARDRKELLRTLICEVIVTIKEEPRRAEVEIAWEGGARTELQVPLIRRGGERRRTAEDTVERIGQIAVHTSDQQIAAILNKQGRRTGTGLPFNQLRVKHVRQQHAIPAAPPYCDGGASDGSDDDATAAPASGITGSELTETRA